MYVGWMRVKVNKYGLPSCVYCTLEHLKGILGSSTGSPEVRGGLRGLSGGIRAISWDLSGASVSSTWSQGYLEVLGELQGILGAGVPGDARKSQRCTLKSLGRFRGLHGVPEGLSSVSRNLRGFQGRPKGSQRD